VRTRVFFFRGRLMQLPLIDDELLRNVSVASPCPARWEEMQGDDRSRFCSECRLHVYDLSAMTAHEAAALIREKEGNLCVRFYRRTDGTMLTADCPVGIRARLRRRARRAGALVATLLAAFTSIACDDGRSNRDRDYDVPADKPGNSDTPFLGKIGSAAGVRAVKPSCLPAKDTDASR
jgi:hypothetical protein